MTIKSLRSFVVCALALQFAACAPSQPDVPYPAFVLVDEIPDVFIAGLPGVRAKGLVGANSDSAGRPGKAPVAHRPTRRSRYLSSTAN